MEIGKNSFIVPDQKAQFSSTLAYIQSQARRQTQTWPPMNVFIVLEQGRNISSSWESRLLKVKDKLLSGTNSGSRSFLALES